MTDVDVTKLKQEHADSHSQARLRSRGKKELDWTETGEGILGGWEALTAMSNVLCFDSLGSSMRPI